MTSLQAITRLAAVRIERYHRCMLLILCAGLLAACSAPAAQPQPSIPPPTPEYAAAQTAGSPIPEPPERDVYRLAAELAPGVTQDSPKVAALETGVLQEGRVDTFWLADLDQLNMYKSQFELAHVSDHAYWYVESGQQFDPDDLRRSATAFDQQVYPVVTSVFGSEWSPGVDGDARLTILNGHIRGAGGYFNSTDEYPREIFEFSNQREMVYVNTANMGIGSSGYLATLAHELQHLIHWRHDPSEDTWVNEGLSELAISVAGFSSTSIMAYTDGTPTSLVNWPLDSVRIRASYGTAALFMHYLAEHYGPLEELRLLLETPGDGVAGIEEYLQRAGYDRTFQDVFADWAVANFLDLPEGVYGYPELHVRARTNRFIDSFTEFESEIPQYSVEYVALEGFEGPFRIKFQGSRKTGIIAADVGAEGCWWSNAGDAIDSTLTHDLDLHGMDRAALRYDVWYDLEENWDYAYVQVSTDGGSRWEILKAPGTSPENPMGNSYGDGYTGNSGGWTTESVDLSHYAGQQLQVRFQYLTDDAVHGPGLCLRGIGLVAGGEFGPLQEWRPRGFVLTNNELAQTYIVQLIESNDPPKVTLMALDQDNSGSFEVPAPGDLKSLVVVVAALAPKTFQYAKYNLTIKPIESADRGADRKATP